MKIKIDVDERYPHNYFYPASDTSWGYEVEISDELYKEFKRIKTEEEWMQVQLNEILSKVKDLNKALENGRSPGWTKAVKKALLESLKDIKF